VPAYLDVAGFKEQSEMPDSDIDALDDLYPGWLDKKLAAASRFVDAQLIKRYQVPFVSPYPETILEWVSRLVTVRAFIKRGVDPTDDQFDEIKKDRDAALAEIQQAANGVDGLYELPITASTSSSGVTKGGPQGYSEQSPYVAFDRQRETASDEDRNGTGTGG